MIPLFSHGQLGVNGWCTVVWVWQIDLEFFRVPKTIPLIAGIPNLESQFRRTWKYILVVTLEPFKTRSFFQGLSTWPPDLLSNFSLACWNQDGLEREDPICQPKGRWRWWQTAVGRQSALGEDQRGKTIDGNGLKEEREYPNHGPLAAKKTDLNWMHSVNTSKIQ